MAFENVFQGIDFQAPVMADAQRQAQFLNILGNAISSAQQQAQFDKRIALEEAKMQQKPFDLEQAAQQAAFQYGTTGQMSPEGQAAIQAYQAFQRPIMDQAGNLIQPANVLQNLGYGQPTEPAAPAAPMGVPQSVPQSYGPMQPASLAPVFPDMEAQVPSIPANVSPATKQMAQEEVVKKTLEEQFAERKELAEKTKGRPAQERKIMEQAMKFQNINNVINDAIGMVDNFSAGVGSVLSDIPATSAKDLSAKLETIGADSAFGALQEMRDNSKTGGALGSIAVAELDLLKASQSALDQDQSPAELRKNLRNYQQVRLNALRRVADAYEQDYGERPESIDSLIKEMTPQMPSKDEIQKELKRRGLIQ